MKKLLFTTALLTATLTVTAYAEDGYFNTKQGRDVAENGYFNTKQGRDVAENGYFNTKQGKGNA